MQPKNKHITVGVIGGGRIGRVHAENLLQLPDVRIAGIADIYPDLIFDWAKAAGITTITDNPSKLIVDKSIDAVLICSPTNTHIQFLEAAAKARKHIFCEKPISFTVAQTERAVKMAMREGVLLQVGLQRAFDPAHVKLKEELASGKLGELRSIEIFSRSPNPPPRTYLEGAGGMFYDKGIHDFAALRYLTGQEAIRVIALGSASDPVVKELGDVDESVTTVLLSGGAIGVVHNSRKGPGYDQLVTIHGSKGNSSIANMVKGGKPVSSFLERYKSAYRAEIVNFITCLRQHKEPRVDGGDGLAVERIADAATRSYKEGRMILLNNE